MKKITAGDERRENGQQLDGTPEMRVWQAVIASTVEEWVHGPLRRAREAEQYLFDDQNDFRFVCESAGIDPDRLRAKLVRFRDRAALAAHARSNRN